MQAKDPLALYKGKRNFSLTPEPSGDINQGHTVREFVIQKHDARRTHYDLRLELNGVLKSWAVPKGPSLEQGQKRLAVNVEDHPLEYLNFEGTIPAGQYGAGDMIIWDRGTWTPWGDPNESLAAGHIKFSLNGQKLHGKWALIRMNNKTDDKKDWLLIKENDDNESYAAEIPATNLTGNSANSLFLSLPSGAKPGVVPAQISPQLATLADKVPVSDDWLYEIKFDGYRILTRYDHDSITIYTRNGHDWTKKLHCLLPALKEIKIAPGWLDGEIVILGERGVPDFGALQSAFESDRTDEIVYYVFDLIYYAGYDLRASSLASRRILLSNVLKDTISPRVRFSENFAGTGSDILHSACSLGLEGVVGKRKQSVYTSGRTQNWIKLKCNRRQELIIVGYTPGERSGWGFKSLLLGVYDEEGELHYAGKVGTGFNNNSAGLIKEKLNRLTTDKSPLYIVPPGIKAHWVKPELAAEVDFTEWTRDGRVRHGVFKGLRTDKEPARITRELPTSAGEKSSCQEVSRLNMDDRSSSQTISNPERVVDKNTGITKLDIANYYKAAAKWILPYFQNRPTVFVRAPDGLDGGLFFQKHADKLKIPGLKQLDPNLDPGHPPLITIDSLETLIGAVQMNVIEFHTWNAKTGNIEKPDRMVFDLDPGEGTDWTMMLEAAQLVRTMLEELDLQSFLKTSGGKGLHIIVPLKPRDDWETIKKFAKGVASHLASTVPSYFTEISGPRNRIGKIYVDYNRNGRGATTAEAFSVRARTGMGVSMPCSWKELPHLTGGAHWTVVTAHSRLESENNPWIDYDQTRQLLKAAAKKIMLGRQP